MVPLICSIQRQVSKGDNAKIPTKILKYKLPYCDFSRYLSPPTRYDFALIKKWNTLKVMT